MKKNYDSEFKEIVYKEGYTLMTPYKTDLSKVILSCPKRHKYLVVPKCFKNGDRCPFCSIKSIGCLSKINFEIEIVKSGYKLLTPYVRNAIYVGVECYLGHYRQVTPDKFKHDKRCPECDRLKKKA